MSIAIARDWQSASLPPTYRAMAILPPMVGPRAALKDLTAFMRQRSREQVIGASLAVLVTVIIVIIFFVDSQINTAPPQQIVYIENYGPDRTDADIIADQKKASEDRRRAAEEKKRQFQELEKRLGIE
ncbi:MAG: hypothetical protein M3Q19_03955 [Pseudomonadota bacterium]|nr:hypothetical protein [Pseudomonadota bacterium]